MSYNPNIPQLTTPKPIVQQQFLNNWQVLRQAFNNNHMPLNDPLQGMHKVMTMTKQSGDPTTGATQIALYTKLTGANNAPNLFFAPDTAQTPIQLTYDSVSTGADKAQQYTFMAGPFIIYGGLLTSVTANQVVNLTPSSTLLYVGLTPVYIVLPGVDTAISSCAIDISGASFKIAPTFGITGHNVYYTAIGQP